MMLTITCDICGKSLGRADKYLDCTHILPSPDPLTNIEPQKNHLCKGCYCKLKRLVDSGAIRKMFDTLDAFDSAGTSSDIVDLLDKSLREYSASTADLVDTMKKHGLL